MQHQISGPLTRGQGSIEPELMHARFMCNLCGEALITVISWGVVNYTLSPVLNLEWHTLCCFLRPSSFFDRLSARERNESEVLTALERFRAINLDCLCQGQ